MIAGSVLPFQLTASVTVAAVSTNSTSMALPLIDGSPALGEVIVVSNPNAAPAYIAGGREAVVSGINSVVVLGGQTRVLDYNTFVRFDPFPVTRSLPVVSAILAAGRGLVIFEIGRGVGAR